MKKSLTDEEVIKFALTIKPTTTPTQALVRGLMDEYGVSEKVASRAYSRVMSSNLLKQVWKTKWVCMKHKGSNAMLMTGSLNVPEGYCSFQKTEEA